MELEQRYVIRFLQVKGLKLNEIATELPNTYGRDASAPPSIKYWLHQIKLGRTDLKTQHGGGRPRLDDIDAEILLVLRKFTFSSRRMIADSLNIPAPMIHAHLAEKIDLNNFYFVGFPAH
jgi:transposase